MSDQRCRMCNPASADPMSFCSRHAIELVNGRDPFSLLEEVDDPAELPTVGEWLAAGTPMREVELSEDVTCRLDAARRVLRYGLDGKLDLRTATAGALALLDQATNYLG